MLNQPVPSKVLTLAQKELDMKWIFSKFDENYAPLEYKLEKYHLNYDDLKAKYLASALATKNNEEFYHVMQRFVAEFKDAHTTTSLNDGGLPNRAKIAYLGFTGKRVGSSLVVTEILPTFKQEGSHFPIHEGDEITAMDGRPLTDIIEKDSTLLHHLGQDESNLTFHMNRLFTRVSFSQIFPTEQNAVLTVKRPVEVAPAKKRGHKRKASEDQDDHAEGAFEEVELTIPWVIRDIYEFRKDQKLAVLEGGGSEADLDLEDDEGLSDGDDQESQAKALRRKMLGFFSLNDPKTGLTSFLGLRTFSGHAPNFVRMAESKINRGPRAFLDSFYLSNQIEGWTTAVSLDAGGEPMLDRERPLESYKKLRTIPEDAKWITSEDAVYPTYVSAHPGGGKKKLIAYMYLDTFSPQAESDEVVEEVKQTLESLEFYGIHELIIDLINNGGGNLDLGMKLSQALSSKRVEMPAIQFRTSQSWIDQFESMSLKSGSDAEKELARRVFVQLSDEYKKGMRLSSPVSAGVLVPFELEPNNRLKSKFEMVLLVNEMCTSMCDIFAAILQDNRMARVVGSRTMGAGGNVETHYQAPHSHLELRQTESLILRRAVKPNGSVVETQYVENNGVTPDYEMDVSATVMDKYRGVRETALEILTAPLKKKARKSRS
jgi:C-terminal processing protease CtpA/Prc